MACNPRPAFAALSLSMQFKPVWDPSLPPYSHPSVLALPHCGFSTEDVYDDIVSLVVQNICACKKGGDLINRIC